MQTQKKNSDEAKTPGELLDEELMQQAIAKVIFEMHEFDLRSFQQSINFGIFAVAIIDQDEFLIPQEARDHVHKLHYLCNYLFSLENIVTGKNTIHE